MLLQVKQASIQFGGLKVIEGLDLELSQGELVGLIGPNGAGKTTAFNLISGIYRPTSGDIRLEGESLLGLKAYEIARRGVVRTFQNIRLFSTLSVVKNIQVSMHSFCSYGLSSALFATGQFRKAEQESRQEAMRLLEFFSLEHLAEDEAGSLPYGVQRKIEIMRALAGRPKLLLLDEPAAGLNHSETVVLMELIQKIRREFNVAVLLIEHDMKLVMGICERIVVLDHGTVIAQGRPTEIQGNKKVIEAYLGVEEDAI